MNITKIQDKYYDLSNFNHPGGETAIWHSYGRDATVLFKSHHPIVSQKKINAILKQYEITTARIFFRYPVNTMLVTNQMI